MGLKSHPPYLYGIVQIGSGFNRPPAHDLDFGALSEIDEWRARRATGFVQTVQPGRDTPIEYWTTGMVGWDPVGPNVPTLAGLNEARVREVLSETLVTYRQVPGLNPFSQSWNACQMAKRCGVHRLCIVSSDFYFILLKQVWRTIAERIGVGIDFITDDHPKYLVTKEVRTYYRSRPLRLMSELAISSTVGHWLAMTLADWRTRSYATIGYRLDGHTKII